MTSMTPERLGQVLSKLSLNYGRGVDDPAAAAGLMDMWQTGIGGCSWEDVEAALNAVITDPTVTRFPTVAEFRQRVIASNHERRRVASEAHDQGLVSCLTCNDSGFVEQGHDEDGYEYVQPCPRGCTPPATNRVRRAAPRRKKRTAEQQKLGLAHQPLLRDAIDATNRMQGDHGQAEVLDEPF